MDYKQSQTLSATCQYQRHTITTTTTTTATMDKLHGDAQIQAD